MDANINTSEVEMLLMLLQKEEKMLHIEINHASHREYKVLLKERLKMVTELMEKLKVSEPHLVL